MLSITDVIEKKSAGESLTDIEIHNFVDGVSSGSVTEAQLGGFTMAVRLMGMDGSEQTLLTLAMRDSGSVLQWDLNGPVLDKHSTGGVGDGVSLSLAPMMAACGAYVPMISGRGLGHTGGTLDKLESIPGYNVQMPLEQLQAQVSRTGMAMVGQGPELAPADGRMYAIRDVTSTVESIPLIVSSILSKKLAEGLDGLVLDVKTGNGAFMQELERSRLLAQHMCKTAEQTGVSCSALITDMNEPLGWTAGNALELNEAIDFLTGVRRNPRMEAVTTSLATELLMLGGLADYRQQAREKLREVLDNGSAAEKFAENVVEQGGPPDLLENRNKYFERATVIREVRAPNAGWISSVDTRELGMAVVHLGGGRMHVEDTIDPKVGLADISSVGERIESGQPLCVIHAENEQDFEQASAHVISAMGLQEEPCQATDVIYEYISGE